MSGRKNTARKQIETAKSLASSFTSPVTTITYLDNLAYQIIISTTNSTGTFKVQGSIDYSVYSPSGQVENPGTWTDLTLGGGTPFANAADDSILISMNQLPFVAIRLVYTSTVAGTGTCDVWVNAKEIGG